MLTNAEVITLPGPLVERSESPVVVDPLQYPGWDALLNAHPNSSFFHSAAWARVLHETYGHRPLYFCRFADGRLVELLPVMEVSSRWTGRRGVSLPFTDHCPVLGSGSSAPKAMIEACIRQGRERGWRYFEYRGMTGDMDYHTPSLKFHAHTLNLERTEEHLFAGLQARERTYVRRAQEANVEVHFETSPEAVRAFYRLHCQTRRKHGLPPQPFAFFENIQRQVLAKGMGRVAIARWQGRDVAANVCFDFGRRAIYKFGASDPHLPHLRCTHLLMWEVIRWYQNRGFESLDFGRTSLANQGLRQFKRGFGPEETEIVQSKFDFRSNAFVTETDRVYGWFNHFFRRLPLPLLRVAGELLYPHLS